MARALKKSSEVEIYTEKTAPPPTRRTLKKFLLALGVLVLAGLSAADLLGVFDDVDLGGWGDRNLDHVVASFEDGHEDLYRRMPSLLANISNASGEGYLLKLDLNLYLASKADVPSLDRAMPKLLDGFNLYLRQMSVGDIQGEAGLRVIKTNLDAILNDIVRPRASAEFLFLGINVQPSSINTLAYR